MANSHVSYLQTLAKDEAIAFVSSLQKVKEHLSHELHWVNEQAQQKTLQLQGIETLLTEAVGLGLAPHTTSTKTPIANISEVSAAVTEAVLSSVSQATAALPDQAPLAVENGNNPTVNATAATSALPKRGKQRQSDKPSKSTRDAKASTARQPSTAKAEKPARSIASASDTSQASSSGFQSFLQPDFKDKSMTDAVGEILESAAEPLNTDAIMTELYQGLSGDSYQRAKSSLSNILSVGKTKGKWKSPARGMYIGNTTSVKAK